MSLTLTRPASAHAPGPKPPSSHATSSPSAAPREIRLRELADRIRAIEGEARSAGAVRPTGVRAFDRWLPWGGFREGTLTDCLVGRRGVEGSLTVWSWIGRLVASEGWSEPVGACVVLDPDGSFHPAPLLRWGWPPGRLTIVRPASRADLAWAAEQALASPSVTAVVVLTDTVDERVFRRWQLAAATGGAVGFLIRSNRQLAGPAWADLRLRLDRQGELDGPGRRTVRLELVSTRGGVRRPPLNLGLDDETGVLSVVSPVARPAVLTRVAS